MFADKPFKRLHIVIESTIWTLHKMGSQENTWLIQYLVKNIRKSYIASDPRSNVHYLGSSVSGSLKKCWTIGKAIKDL